MGKPPDATFRTALQVTSARMAALTAEDLNVLMYQLLQAQAYRCDSPVNQIRVNTQGSAGDKGCDGWTARPKRQDDWLGATDTCWQFKSGTNGEPAKLKGEVINPIPKETLMKGGRFVVVASGSTSGVIGERKRLATLKTEAKNANIPFDKIEVIGSERLTNWCNQHPPIAAPFAARPEGLWTLDLWLQSEEHQAQYQSSPTSHLDIEGRRRDLDFANSSICHFHIFGPPGVGKTRFALELCRDAAWRHAVIYMHQAEDGNLVRLIRGAVEDPGVQLIVVADEAQDNQLVSLRDSLEGGSGRVRLVTVGYNPSPDPRRIPALEIKPLDHGLMCKVIAGWYPSMPPEHVDFIAHFADGYVRLARLASDSIARNPSLDVHGLISAYQISAFLDRMLGSEPREALHVLAVLTRVGWEEDKEDEGQAVAEHMGLQWSSVRSTVQRFHKSFRIAPRGGRYRYISPRPLAIYLAVEAWETHPNRLRSLPDVLPRETAKDAYYARLESIANSPQARKYAREELSFFFELDHFLDGNDVRRWASLTTADPDEAAQNILTAIEGASIEDRLRIKDAARREMVWNLVRLAWRPSSFHDAVKALALLAEAENETWANNASGEFVARFQIYLGGTAVHFVERLAVLDELLDTGRVLLASLVVKALTQAGLRRMDRMSFDPAFGELSAKEWGPHDSKEYFVCLQAAITRLEGIAKLGRAEIQLELVAAAQQLSWMLGKSALQGLAATFFRAMRDAFPEAREPLRRVIANIIEIKRESQKDLAPEELEQLERLHAEFEDSTLEGRLKQFVGQALWGQETQPDLRPLAKEILLSPQCLAALWSWLTSGEASNAWQLGKALAEADLDGQLEEVLPSLSGGGDDLRLVCGYICTRRQSLGDKWYDQWVVRLYHREPQPVSLLFDVAAACGATESVAVMITTILRSGPVNPQVVGRLGFIRWHKNLSSEALETMLRAMTNTGHCATAIAILADRMNYMSTEAKWWEPLALDLVLTPELIQGTHMTSYYWREVAIKMVSDYPREIAEAIFRQAREINSSNWFGKGTNVAKVLGACIEQAPAETWEAMQPFLSSAADSFIFSLTFPAGLLDRMPADDVEAWIAGNPEERAAIAANLTRKDVSTDETLASRVLGKYGDKKKVAQAFFSNWISGVWSGPTSIYFGRLADSLEETARRSELPKLRRWASNSARSLRKTAELERQREEEEELTAR